MAGGRVVVGVDVPETSGQAVRWAADAAARHGVPLVLVHATDEAMGRPFVDADDATRDLLVGASHSVPLIEGAVTAVREAHPDLAVEQEVVVGDAVQSLLDRQEGALLVVGTGRRNALSEMILGSTSLGVAMHASSPVAVVPPAPDASAEASVETHGVVIVAVDGSPDSAVAARVACAEAAALGARVVAVHTWALEIVDGYVVTESDAAEFAAVQDRQTQVVERALAPARAAHPDVPIDIEVRNGPVVRTLVERSATADLLVLGSRGRGGFAGKLLGSVSHRVLRGSACPVIIAKADRSG